MRCTRLNLLYQYELNSPLKNRSRATETTTLKLLFPNTILFRIQFYQAVRIRLTPDTASSILLPLFAQSDTRKLECAHARWCSNVELKGYCNAGLIVSTGNQTIKYAINMWSLNHFYEKYTKISIHPWRLSKKCHWPSQEGSWRCVLGPGLSSLEGPSGELTLATAMTHCY